MQHEPPRPLFPHTASGSRTDERATGSEPEPSLESGSQLDAARAADAAWREERKRRLVRRIRRLSAWGARLDRVYYFIAIGFAVAVGVGLLWMIGGAFFGSTSTPRGRLGGWGEWIGRLQYVYLGLMAVSFGLDRLLHRWRRSGEREGIELEGSEGTRA